MKYNLFFSLSLSLLIFASCTNLLSSENNVDQQSDDQFVLEDYSEDLIIDYPDSIKSYRDSLMYRAKIKTEYAAKIVNKAKMLADSAQAINNRLASTCDSVSIYLDELKTVSTDK